YPTFTRFPYTTLFRSVTYALPDRVELDALVVRVAGGRRTVLVLVQEVGLENLELKGNAQPVRESTWAEPDNRLARMDHRLCDERSEEHTSELQSRENL